MKVEKGILDTRKGTRLGAARDEVGSKARSFLGRNESNDGNGHICILEARLKNELFSELLRAGDAGKVLCPKPLGAKNSHLTYSSNHLRSIA
jgi:hypothetical protein